MIWNIHHRAETISTNLDARAGKHGDVFTADFQSAGRGRLDHRWLSPPGTNLMMSAVVSVAAMSPESAATLPLVAGLACVRAANRILSGKSAAKLKWPNDVLVDGRKLAGILCERTGDNVIVGIGVNVGQENFAPELTDRVISMRMLLGENAPSVETVRDAILGELADFYATWRTGGFAAVHQAIADADFLRGRMVSVRQTDNDDEPIVGVCGGIQSDGSLNVAGQSVYAGEAHVSSFSLS